MYKYTGLYSLVLYWLVERDEQYLCTSIPVQFSTVSVGGEDCTVFTSIPVQFSTVMVGEKG